MRTALTMPAVLAVAVIGLVATTGIAACAILGREPGSSLVGIASTALGGIIGWLAQRPGSLPPSAPPER